jgi:hypothetical protein
VSAENILPLMPLATLLGFFLFDHMQKLHKTKNILAKVQWIASKSTSKPEYDGCYGDNNLTFYIKNTTVYAKHRKGIKLYDIPYKIPEECLIDFSDEQEQLHVETILSSFKMYKIDNFFRIDERSLNNIDKFIYKMRDESYFMFSLICYIENCVKYDSYDFRDKVYEKREDVEPPYFKCKLTPFGRVCYKLYLIASIYCENTYDTQPLINSPYTKNIIGDLKKNEAMFWTIRS